MLKFFRRKKNDGSNPQDPKEGSALPPSSDPLSEAPEAAEPTATKPENTLVAQTQEPTAEPESTLIADEPSPVSPPEMEAKPQEKGRSWFGRLKDSLTRTRASFTEGIASLFLGKKEIDKDLLETLETHLLKADVGVEATRHIIQTLTQGISRKELKDPQAVYNALQNTLSDMLKSCEQPLAVNTEQRPFVLLMIGVNGAGKTTTIGKLAKRFQQSGLSVMLAAGDTFRAAAIEQLQVWGERNKIPVLAQHTGAEDRKSTRLNSSHT